MQRSTTSIGTQAETWACEYLREQGYEILERNVRTRHYEIDCIVRDKKTIVFVEVKFRRNAQFGGGEAAITKDKYTRLEQAVQDWLTHNSKHQTLQPRIDVIVITARRDNLHHYTNVSEQI